MALGDDAQELRTDVSKQIRCVFGRANVRSVRDELEQMGVPVSGEIKDALDKLETYFAELCEGMGARACPVAFIHEVYGGGTLREADIKALEAAGSRRIPTTIDKEEAMRLATLIGDYVAALTR